MTDPVTEEYRQSELNREWLKNNDLASAGGGGTPGAVRVLKFPFAFNTPNLATGVPVWTPAVDDWLLNAWIETRDGGWTADGEVLPKADIGIIDTGAWVPGGFFALVKAPVDLTGATWTTETKIVWYNGTTEETDINQGALQNVTAPGTGALPVQIKFTTTDPLSLVVSDDGTPSGDAFDGSAGASTLYIVVSTPGDAS